MAHKPKGGTHEMMVREIFNHTRLTAVSRAMAAQRDLYRWRCFRQPGQQPPQIVKQLTVREYGRRFRASVLIESGTYLGDMVEAQRRGFARVYSIELEEGLALRAKQRFAAWTHIEILTGDSATVLPRLLPGIDGSLLFWLDGHFSGGLTAMGPLATPISAELNCILQEPISTRTAAILIDDARLFCGENDYPTLEALERQVRAHRPDWHFEVRDDIIRTHPRIP